MQTLVLDTYDKLSFIYCKTFAVLSFLFKRQTNKKKNEIFFFQVIDCTFKDFQNACNSYTSILFFSEAVNFIEK